MAEVKMEQLAKNRVKFTITVPAAEAQPFLEEAATRLSESSNIPGFRPGKAGYDIVKQRVGEMKIMEEALETIVRRHLVKAILENNIETVGSPSIDVEKMAPGNDVVFTAEVTRMPKIEKLAEFRKLSVKAKPVEVTEKEIDLVMKDLQRMQTREVRAKADESVGAGDKVVVSMNMNKGGVAVDGGSSPNHAIYLNEDYYIPGLKEQLLGLKEGEKKTFTLPFPKDHVQKLLAGSEVNFEVALKELYHLEVPSLDDAFATSIGQKDLATLRVALKENLTKEKEAEEKFRQEREILELIAEKSRFEDIPELLVNEEVNKMVHELEHRVEEQDGEFEKYLSSIKKTLADLKLDFSPQAILRVKVALILREIGNQEKIEANQKRVDEELDALAHQHEDEETKKQIYSPQYRMYIESVDRNRQIIELLRKAMIK